MSDDRFFIRIRGRVQGPFNGDQLRTMARTGRFSRAHEVSTDGQAWGRATDYPDLFPKVEVPVRQAAVAAQAAVPVAEEVYPLEAAPTPPPPPERAQWYYSRGGTEAGPVEFTQLQGLALGGQLQAADLVWMVGTPSWVQAQQVQGLFPTPPVVASPTSPWLSPPVAAPVAAQVVAPLSSAGQFTCPFCQSHMRPVVQSKVSTGGWVLFVVLLFACFPLCLIGLLVREQYRTCSSCGINLG